VRDFQFCMFFCMRVELGLSLKEGRRLSLIENRVLRKILGPKGVEIRGDCRTLYNKELYDLYFSQNLILVIKSRRMSYTGMETIGEGGGG